MIRPSLPTVRGGESKCTMSKINAAEHGLQVPNGCLAVKYVYTIIMTLYYPQEQWGSCTKEKEFIKVPRNHPGSIDVAPTCIVRDMVGNDGPGTCTWCWGPRGSVAPPVAIQWCFFHNYDIISWRISVTVIFGLPWQQPGTIGLGNAIIYLFIRYMIHVFYNFNSITKGIMFY